MPRSVGVRTGAGMMSGMTPGGSMSWSFWRGWSRSCRSRAGHSIRYYGYCAAVVRAKRRRATADAEAHMTAAGNDAVGNDAGEARGEAGGVRPAVAAYTAVASEPDTAERKQLRKNWAALIRRVYEADPLVCACGATMRIVAVITERSVITKILAHLAKVAAASATEGSATGWCDHRTGRGLFGPVHSPAQARRRRPSRLAPTAATRETASTFLAIVSKSSARMEIAATNSRNRSPWTRARNAFSYPSLAVIQKPQTADAILTIVSRVLRMDSPTVRPPDGRALL
ncbi:MAG: hypothetical protein ACSLFQ_13950 [Thermoanaerobaculia bacterium]